jgi:hypothetical protein
MKIDCRNFDAKKILLFIPENEEESMLIDEYLGDKIPTAVEGEVTLSDDYGQHYISLSRKEEIKSET